MITTLPPPTTAAQYAPFEALTDRGTYRLYHDAKSLNAGFTEMLHELTTICRAEYVDEDGNKIEPAMRAMFSLIEVLVNCSYELAASYRRALPRGSVAMDEDGGFRIEWNFGDNAVFLEIASGESSDSYIYFQNGNQTGIVRQVTGQRLAEQLRALLR